MKYKFGKKLREIRKKKSFTMKEVSEQVGVSESLISQIETEKVYPAVDTLISICEFLKVDPSIFFTTIVEKDTFKIVKKQDREIILKNGVKYEKLSTIFKGNNENNVEAYYMEIDPNCNSGNEDYGHKGKELGTIVEGSGEFVIGGKSIKLSAGDTITFDSSIPHKLTNIGKTILKTYWTITPPK